MVPRPFQANAVNLSAVLHKAGDLRLELAPMPTRPNRNEVLLETRVVGICGSDVSYWVKGYIGDFVVNKPMILGHETSALVYDVGEGVRHLKAGDRVAVEPGVPCRCCVDCKEGSYNLCQDIFFSATPPDHGTLTRYFKHDASFCYKLPDNVSFDEGALMEPLSVALHAFNRAALTGGTKVLICGAGPIGLMCILTAKAFGVANICITDINQERLNLAKHLGADKTVLIERDAQERKMVAKILEEMGGPPDAVLECSGAETSIRSAIMACKSGGVVVLIGMGPSEVTVPLMAAATKEIDIRGCFRYRNSYPKALALVASGKINVKPLITHRYMLEETLEAFEMALSGKAVKILIDCGDNRNGNHSY